MPKKEGIAAAKIKGVKFGAVRKALPENFEKYYDLWIKKELTVRQAATELGISSTMFYRRCRELTDKKCQKI